MMGYPQKMNDFESGVVLMNKTCYFQDKSNELELKQGKFGNQK